MQPLSSGVPQGSILGPILFLLYVNDLHLNLQSNIDMYADDATLYKSSKSLSEINELLQNYLSKIDTWSKHNNMILNPKKTTCMITGCKKRLKNIPELQLKVLNNKIENVSVQRVLELYIDNSLCWKTHVDKVCSKVSSKVHVLKRKNNFLTLDMEQLFYNSYIAPYFDYGCISWNHCKPAFTNRIIKLQKRAACIFLEKPRKTSSKSNFTSLKWLSIIGRQKYFTTLMVYKTLHGLAPPYMSNLESYSRSQYHMQRSELNNDVTNQSIPRTEFRKQTFSYIGMQYWNSNPIDLRSINNIKQKLKHFLMSLDF